MNLPGVVVRTPAVSAVVITACEYMLSGPFGVKTLIRGDASIWVENVHPYVRVPGATDPGAQNGGVEFVIHVNSDSPLLVATTITVFDDPVIVPPGVEV